MRVRGRTDTWSLVSWLSCPFPSTEGGGRCERGPRGQWRPGHRPHFVSSCGPPGRCEASPGSVLLFVQPGGQSVSQQTPRECHPPGGDRSVMTQHAGCTGFPAARRRAWGAQGGFPEGAMHPSRANRSQPVTCRGMDRESLPERVHRRGKAPLRNQQEPRLPGAEGWVGLGR